ncbi:hypothetical protein [Zavarzinella formosa]|uniref:hypothetical protein n=1 Tax=Zavarzinella formosa TaxID=360055 RepID=UPI0002EE7322|nr:hypothetical protein [Zavarzinella formosa]
MKTKLELLIAMAQKLRFESGLRRRLALEEAIRIGKKLLPHADDPGKYGEFDKEWAEMLAKMAEGVVGK